MDIFSTLGKIVAGALGIWDKWLGSYITPQSTKSRQIIDETEKLDEFAELSERARQGDKEAQEEIRARLHRPTP